MPITLLQNEEAIATVAKLRVVGVGGGGGNIINSMIEKGISDVEFIAINTDSQALSISSAELKMQIGRTITNGLGTGMDSDKGEKAAEENKEEIEKVLKGSNMIFLTAGMGGGTGTGAAPIIAKIAKSMGALVVAIVTKPFDFEGQKRMDLAIQGIEKLRKEVDSLIVIPNQKIFSLIQANTKRKEAFDFANLVLYNATRGISEIITKTGEVNVDFADVKTIMSDQGDAIIGMGKASGEDRAEKAAAAALSNPVLDEVNIEGAKSVLVNILTNGDISMSEMEKVYNTIKEAAGNKANYIMGFADDPDMKSEMTVTVIATGFKNKAISKGIEISATINNKQKNILDVDFLKDKYEQYNNETELANKEKIQTPYVRKITRIPTEEELNNLLIPSYQRNNINISEDMEEYNNKEENDDSAKFGFDDFSSDEEYGTPDFLRKQSQ